MILVLILALCLVPIALLVVDLARLTGGSGRESADRFAGTARGPLRPDVHEPADAGSALENIPAIEERRVAQMPFVGVDRRKTAALPAAAPVRRPLGVPAELEAETLRALVDAAASGDGRRRHLAPVATPPADVQAARSA